MSKTTIALTLALALLAHGETAWAESPAPESGATQFAYGAASVAGSLIYTPIKLGLCGLGIGAAGFALLSGPDAMKTVFVRSCHGTWVLTPQILKRQEPLRFVEELPCCGYPPP
ncbi:MAG TPA: hypothetical protein VEL75_24035 [Candidatus Methylomirabilis sp.]|nr:hypothetical protein [Candidatus Methylomirabilis sp.]